MNPSRIETITDYLNEVRMLDNEIIHLQSTAKKLIDGEMILEFTLDGFVPNQSRIIINEEGDMVDPDKAPPKNMPSFVAFIVQDFKGKKGKKSADVYINQSVNQSSALRILAVLLEEKQQLKKDHHRKLERLGVTITDLK